VCRTSLSTNQLLIIVEYHLISDPPPSTNTIDPHTPQNQNDQTRKTKMVFTQLLMDSVSRCFGVPDGSSPVSTTNKFADQPLGASRESKHHQSSSPGQNHSDREDSSQNDHDCHARRPQLDANNCPIRGKENFMPPHRRNHSNEIPLDVQLNDGINDISFPHDDTDSEVLANARNQAFQRAPPKSRRSKSSSSVTDYSGLNPLTHEASIEKSRTKCSKRKLDIFRTGSSSRNHKQPNTSSFASRLLGDGSFPSGAMLCFANPILDDEEDIKLQRADEMMLEDEETVASTLFFDAKYAHVVEEQPPFALYPSFQVTKGDSLVDIFQSASHKTITSIYCPNPPSPPKKESRMESMADDVSVNDSEANCSNPVERRTNTETSESATDYHHHHNKRHPTATTSTSTRHFVYEPQELDVISMVTQSKESSSTDNMRSMKLMTNSSQSTAALTPVCSSRSHASMSPVHEDRHRVATPIDVNEIQDALIR